MTTLLDRIQQVAERRADDVALVIVDHAGERVLTYRAFLSLASAYAAQFRSAGLQAGDVVVLVQDFGEGLIGAFWGAMMLGAVPAIFPLLSDKLDPERYFSSIGQLVEKSEVAAVVADPRFRPALEGALAGIPVRLLTLDPSADAAEPFRAADARLAENTALLQHSSGSTGLQKGVMLSHASILRQIDAYSQALAIQPDDVVVSWLPLYHDMGLIAGFILPLVQGLKLVLMSPFHWVRSPQILLQAIARHRGTLCWQPNFAYNFLAMRVREADLNGLDLSSWRAAVNCSEPIAAESHRLFLKRFAPYGLRADALLTCYAMAENTFAVTQSRLGAPLVIDLVDTDALLTQRLAAPAVEDRPMREMVSCGRPIAGCELRIVDERRQPLPERQVGEILLRSGSMLSGYYRRPELSAQVLQDGWFATGDLGYLADGELYVTGRSKDLIIVGGKNIYPQDIENLVNEVAGVHAGRVVAFGVRNDRLGTEDIVVIAEVTTDEPDAQADIERAIRSRVTQSLDVTLRDVRLVQARWLIKTSSGKIARAANRAKFLEESA